MQNSWILTYGTSLVSATEWISTGTLIELPHNMSILHNECTHIPLAHHTCNTYYEVKLQPETEYTVGAESYPTQP
jgi:hypothetical protein